MHLPILITVVVYYVGLKLVISLIACSVDLAFLLFLLLEGTIEV